MAFKADRSSWGRHSTVAIARPPAAHLSKTMVHRAAICHSDQHLQTQWDGVDAVRQRVHTAGVDEAAEAIRSLFPATPLQLNEHLSKRWGARVYLKREDLSPVRSYKIRGAFNFFRKALALETGVRTFVCASAGNHAQGFAFVCRISASRGSSTCR